MAVGNAVFPCAVQVYTTALGDPRGDLRVRGCWRVAGCVEELEVFEEGAGGVEERQGCTYEFQYGNA